MPIPVPELPGSDGSGLLMPTCITLRVGPRTRSFAAGWASFLCGLMAVAFEDLDCVPVDVDDIDGWLTRPDVQ